MNDELIKLCVDIIAHAECDRRVDIVFDGYSNRYNASECRGVAEKVLLLLGTSEGEVWDRVEARIAEIDG